MVQLDDFPYVYMMRRISEELEKRSQDPIYYLSSALPLTDPKDWHMLMHLINEDYEDILSQEKIEPRSYAEWLFDRLDQAHIKANQEPKLSKLSLDMRQKIALSLEEEAQNLYKDKINEINLYKENSTIVIEFSRGGAFGSTMPLPSPYGYQSSLAHLNDEILEKASIIYLNLSFEKAKDRNEKRYDPNDPSSILHHYVPITVMYRGYGCDDISYLISISDKPNTIIINTPTDQFYLPIAVFDNNQDKTTSFRLSNKSWKKNKLATFQRDLKSVFKKLDEKA